MSNNNGNYNNNNRGNNSDGLVKGLMEVAIPMRLKSAVYETSTPELGNKICDFIANSYGIPEIDHAYTYPIYDKSGRVSDFGMVLYFECNTNGQGTITRTFGGKKGTARVDGNRIDLRGLVSSKTSTGGFNMTPEFVEKIGSLVTVDENGNIPVRADKDYPKLAIIDADFWTIVSIALQISPNDCYDFTITGCTPMNNRDDCIDFNLEISKTIVPQRKKARKSTINYEYRDRQLVRSGRRR